MTEDEDGVVGVTAGGAGGSTDLDSGVGVGVMAALFLGRGMISSSISSSSSKSKAFTSAIIAAFLLGALDLGVVDDSLFVLCSVGAFSGFLAPFCTGFLAFGTSLGVGVGAFGVPVVTAFLAGVFLLLAAGVLAFGVGAAFLVVAFAAFGGGVGALTVARGVAEPLFLGVGIISSSSSSSEENRSLSSRIGLALGLAAFFAEDFAVGVLAFGTGFLPLAVDTAGDFLGLGGDLVLGFLGVGCFLARGVAACFCLRSCNFFFLSSSSS